MRPVCRETGVSCRGHILTLREIHAVCSHHHPKTAKIRPVNPTTLPTARGDRAQRRIDILTAATDIMQEAGWEGLSMREIASRAGVSAGATYKWFTGKDEIFAELYTERLEDGRHQLQDRRGTLELAPLLHLIFKWVRPAWRDLGRWSLEYKDTIESDPDAPHARRLRVAYYELLDVGVAAIHEAAAISGVTVADSPHLGRFVWATANSVAQHAETMITDPAEADDYMAYAANALASAITAD